MVFSILSRILFFKILKLHLPYIVLLINDSEPVYPISFIFAYIVFEVAPSYINFLL